MHYRYRGIYIYTIDTEGYIYIHYRYRGIYIYIL